MHTSISLTVGAIALAVITAPGSTFARDEDSIRRGESSLSPRGSRRGSYHA